MSIKSDNSNVESVAGTVATGIAVGGIVLTAAVIGGIVSLLSKAGEKAYRQSVNSLPQASNAEIKSVKALRAERKNPSVQRTLQTTTATLDAVEAAKVKTFASLSATPYFVSDQASLKQSLSHLRNAKTIQEVMNAEQTVVRQFEVNHSRVLTQSVTLACSRAAMKIGFENVQTETALDGTTRVIAVDPAGRALVTEINADKNYDVAIATEVVGVSDGSCSTLLDSFNDALTSEGVRRTSGKRSFTGGVCELAAARDFIRRKIKPKTVRQQQSTTTTDTNTATRRSQRLNNQTKQKQG